MRYNESKFFSNVSALKYGFNTLFEEFSFFLLLMLVKIGLFFLGLLISIALFFSLTSTTSSFILYRASAANLFILVFLTGLVSFIGLGVKKILLEIYDTGSSSLGVLWTVFPLLWRSILADIIFIFCTAAGIVCFIVPGIYFAIRYGFYKLILIDTSCSVLEAFKRSAHITDGNRWNIFGFITLLFWINSILPVISWFITLPATSLAYIYVYRSLQKRISS
jgi:hypothetical protein